MFNRWLLAALASGVISAQVHAADLVTADMNTANMNTADWSGFYFGGQVGWSHGEMEVTDLDGYNGLGEKFGYDDDGIAAGAHAGYNFQTGSLVFGLETGVGYLGLDESRQYPPFAGVRQPNDSVASTEAGLYVTVTGRAGLAWNDFLLYAKGGWIGADAKVSYIDDDPAGTTLISGTHKSKFKSGYTIGGGLEWAMTDALSVRMEYMYADLGKITHTAVAAAGPTPVRFKHDLEVHTLMVGMSYRF